MTLDEAIEQMVTLGEINPREIADKIMDTYGKEWVREQVAERADDVVAELARRRLGSVRRAAELALRPGDELSAAEMKIAKWWVPGRGWKRADSLTVDDLEAKAEWYRSLATAALTRALWCDQVVAIMRKQGAKTLGRITGALPALPAGDDVVTA
jgi:hypothetical protein